MNSQGKTITAKNQLHIRNPVGSGGITISHDGSDAFFECDGGLGLDADPILFGNVEFNSDDLIFSSGSMSS